MVYINVLYFYPLVLLGCGWQLKAEYSPKRLNYRFWRYTYYKYCQWVIAVPEGDRIAISFSYLDLRNGWSRKYCFWSTLKVYDGKTEYYRHTRIISIYGILNILYPCYVCVCVCVGSLFRIHSRNTNSQKY